VSASIFEVPYDDEALQTRIRGGLDEVERQLSVSIDSGERFVTEVAVHLLRAGGKRFRPLMVLLAAEFGASDEPGIVPSAVVVELTHLATLYHDDVMDEAALRRGAQSANARWDNSIAILAGDYLFAQASQVLAGLGTEAVRIQAETFSRLVQGQIRETLGPTDSEDPVEHYLSVVADKTGSLIATAALFGSKTSGASEDVQQVLTEFGECIGSAFQLADDIIDVASETGDSGKTPGTDLREGIPTLSTLFAQRSTDPRDARLNELLAGPIEDDADVEEALRLLRAHEAMRQARTYVHSQADDARALLAGLPEIPARAALVSLCDVVVTRIG